MTPRLWERLERVAAALQNCPLVAMTSAEQLARWVDAELGPGTLDGIPAPYGGRRRLLQPLSPILHVVSGNTAHAAVQSLVRGLVAGAGVQWVKVPRATRLPELECFVSALPASMRPLLAPDLKAGWLEKSAALAVFGSDETIRSFARRVQPWQRFLPHGHKISFGWIRGPYNDGVLAAVARDVVAYDQLGCLSPQFYLVSHAAKEFAGDLAAVFAREALQWPPLVLSPENAARLREFRDNHELRAALGEEAMVWSSGERLSWTVAYDPRPGLASTPLFRSVVIKPEEAGTLSQLAQISPYLGTVGLHPYTEEHIGAATGLGAQRICRVGAMQNPDWLWHHDGWPSLGAFLRYVDVEN